MLAGWNPDQAWWLTDILATKPSADTWRREDDSSGSGHTWRHHAW